MKDVSFMKSSTCLGRRPLNQGLGLLLVVRLDSESSSTDSVRSCALPTSSNFTSLRVLLCSIVACSEVTGV